MQKAHIKQLAARISGTQIKTANERVKAIVDRLLLDLFNAIDDFDVKPEEFWSALSYVTELGKSNEAALLAAGHRHYLLRPENINALARKHRPSRTTLSENEGPLRIRLSENGPTLFENRPITSGSGPTLMRTATFPSVWLSMGVRLIPIFSAPPFCEQGSLAFVAIHSDNLSRDWLGHCAQVRPGRTSDST
jgi:hypothetical protein